MDCGLLGSSVHGSFQAGLLEQDDLPGDLPDLGTGPESLASPALAGKPSTLITLT